MISKLRWGSVMGLAVVCAALLTGLTGCKFWGQGKQEVSAPEPAARTEPAEKLGLRLVYSDRADPDLPDASLNLRAETGRQPDEKIVASESDELDFPTPIALPNQNRPQGRFLVWSEDWGEGRIRTATLDQRIEEEDGRLVGPTERIDIHYDVASRRWFVPLLDLVRGGRENEHPGKLHRLTFDLTLENGERKIIHVRLRFRAVRPGLSFESVEVFNPLSLTVAHHTMPKLGTDGLLLRTTTITNPADRPITAWLKSGFRMTFTSYISTHVNVTGPNPHTYPVRWQHMTTLVRFVPGVVSRSSGNSDQVTDRSGDWVALSLAAREQVKVNWIAIPVANDSCQLPPPQTKALGSFGTAHGIVSMGGWTLAGQGRISVGSTEIWEDAGALDSAESSVLGSLELDFSLAEGFNGGSSVPPYSCQGWFRL